MQVSIDLDLTVSDLLLYCFLHSPYRRLIDWTRIGIVSIQVLSQRIESIVASIDAIWIQHGHYFKDESIK